MLGTSSEDDSGDTHLAAHTTLGTLTVQNIQLQTRNNSITQQILSLKRPDPLCLTLLKP
jgi:hypothetical protein